jgi:repressor LexA
VRSLTPRQSKMVDFIYRFRTDRHYPPTVRDILGGCGISSTSVVDYNLAILERNGIIRRHSGISRGIELLAGAAEVATVRVPVIGLIAAGAPIPVPAADAWDTVSSADTIEVTMEMTGGKSDVYALRVKGLSMIDALINEGDLVLLQHTSTVENGATAAVWLKAEKEVTLKRVYVEKDRVRLQPANTLMQPIYAAADNVEIQGRVIAVIRNVG